MKKIASLLFILFYINAFSQHDEKYFRFIESNKNIINTEITRIISIDKISKDTIWAYANQNEFEKFNKLNYKVELLTPPSLLFTKTLNMATELSQMENWDRYPTYEVYRAMMKKFEQDYPSLCKLDSIGTTAEGRKLYVIKISDNVSANEVEPEFFYTSTMHGDETTGYVLMLRMIDYLLGRYEIDPRVKAMVDNMAIYINPNSNPDGTYNSGNSTVSESTRYNGNNVDINRNFPDPRAGDHPDGNSWQPETQAMMNFAEQHHFILSANFHGGIELANYPWDTWTSSQNPHPDNSWFYTISRAYADTVHKFSPTDYFTGESNGVTHGGDWYVVEGGRQDYFNYWHHCREVTFEISDTKVLSTDLLPAYWTYNKASMLNYIELAHTGFLGTVTNAAGNPVFAKITVLNHDKDSSEVFTNPNFGNYYRPIAAGTYSITFSANGYTSITLNDVTIPSNESKIINVVMDGAINSSNITGLVHNKSNNTPIPDAIVTITSGGATVQTTTNINGEFSANSVTNGIIKLEVEANEYYSTTSYENLTSSNSDWTIKLIEKQTLSGYVFDSETNAPIEGVLISIVDDNISTTSNSDGFFQLTNLLSGTTQLKFKKANYASYIKDITIPLAEPININLEPTNPESFETNIPEGITFSNGDWMRDNSTSYSGSYSLKSPTIGNSSQTTTSLTLNLNNAGEISFARKVSSESGYDFLKFSIDGVEMGSWSGILEWDEVSYSITSGTHTISWKYIKDGAETGGSDCAWIDNITIPKNTQTVNFTISINGETQEGLSVDFNEQIKATDSEGITTFSGVLIGENRPFSVRYENTELGNGLVTVYWSDINKASDFSCYYNVNFEVKSNGNFLTGATINFNQNQQTTNASGIASFANVPFGLNSTYSVSMSGFNAEESTKKVYRDSTYAITLYPTGISDIDNLIESFTVSPNPFKYNSNISCTLNKTSYVDVAIYDITGQLVLTVFEGELTAGEHSWNWTHSESNLSKTNQGLYIVRISSNGNSIAKKIIHTK